jgi:hypothetical protein
MILPFWGWYGWGDPKGSGAASTFYATGALSGVPHIYDSRYFWLGEWLLYPWQPIEGINEYLGIGGAFEHVYQPYGGKLRALMYRLTTTSHLWYPNSERDERLHPIQQFLVRLYDPHMTDHTLIENGYTDSYSGIYGEAARTRQIRHGRWAESLDSLEPRAI